MITEIWKRFEPLPMGRFLFSRLLSLRVPYSGSIHPDILDVGGGHALVRMRDRRRVRNHLDSIHAVALINLAELASGLALDSALPPDARAILRGYRVEFIAKARGTLVAESSIEPLASNEKRDQEVPVEVRDESGKVVCRAWALWHLGPKKKN